MKSQQVFPLNAWYRNHQDQYGSSTWHQVDALFNSYDAVRSLVGLSDTWETYLADRSQPEPNLVELVFHYGHARLLVHGWTKFPIPVPLGKEEEWREAELGASFYEFYDINIGGAAGGFFGPAIKDTRFTGETIRRQLQETYARLDELTRKPLDWYTPKSFTRDELAEGYGSVERDRISKPFDLFERLVCFEYGFPKLRDFAVTSTSELFQLPNKELYNELREVDLNELAGKIEYFNTALRPIFRFLVAKDYVNEIPWQPESFWWRHPAHEVKRMRENRRRRK